MSKLPPTLSFWYRVTPSQMAPLSLLELTFKKKTGIALGKPRWQRNWNRYLGGIQVALRAILAGRCFFQVSQAREVLIFPEFLRQFLMTW